MSSRGQTPLPRSLLALWVVFDGQALPEAVATLMEAIRKTAGAEKPVSAFNLSVGQLRRQHPHLVLEISQWLARSETQQAAADAGVGWAWREWCQATDKMLLTEKTAGAAFGADKPGRPRAQGFTTYEDAALLAEHLTRNKGLSSSEAESKCVELRGTRDAREVQRQRAKLRSMKITDEELLQQAQLIGSKYKKS